MAFLFNVLLLTANEDPFAGLSLECSTYTLNVTCSKEQYDELIKFMKEKGIEYR